MTAPVIAFTVPGPPVPKARARVVYDQRTRKHRGITPERTRDHERRIALRFWAAYPSQKPLTCRLAVTVRFYLHGSRGDGDNYLKAVSDALNRRAWVDDSQVDQFAVSVVRNSPQPRTEIEVYELETVA